MKIIFLDIDGVMNHLDWMMEVNKKDENGEYLIKEVHPDPGTWRSLTMDPECVKRLNRVTDATGAKIVISSTWRLNVHSGRETKEDFFSFLQGYGITGEIIDITEDGWRHPDIEANHRLGGSYGQRGREILYWKEHCGFDVESYVVFEDDVTDVIDPVPEENVVQTFYESPNGGITEDKADRAIDILGRS